MDPLPGHDANNNATEKTNWSDTIKIRDSPHNRTPCLEGLENDGFYEAERWDFFPDENYWSPEDIQEEMQRHKSRFAREGPSTSAGASTSQRYLFVDADTIFRGPPDVFNEPSLPTDVVPEPVYPSWCEEQEEELQKLEKLAVEEAIREKARKADVQKGMLRKRWWIE
ncbi:hypothetical protein CAEBREN_12250 [Caenorhabditis brenneri]|uniref:Uncharacterized protein n=1 Tax=Caenorhabditis brenneri TaxID=135651 RepID=G0NDL7_CAEBE|nr:hypothetical protein CAEBREN_12250 [Caenorhabditis brenneri]